MAQPTRTRITADEFFALPEYQENEFIQLIDGEVVIGVAPVPKHGFNADNILYYLMTYARNHGGKAASAPVEVMLDERNIYEPDVFYIAPDGPCREDSRRYVGPPDLVVEVLSPGTAKYDKEAKYQAYERNGVREYWIVDPANETFELYTRDDDGTFQKAGIYDHRDTFSSSVLGEDVTIAQIFDPR